MADHVCKFEQVVAVESHWHCTPSGDARCQEWATRKCEFCGSARCASHTPVEPPVGPVMAANAMGYPVRCLNCGEETPSATRFWCDPCDRDTSVPVSQSREWKAGARDFPRRPAKAEKPAPKVGQRWVSCWEDDPDANLEDRPTKAGDIYTVTAVDDRGYVTLNDGKTRVASVFKRTRENHGDKLQGWFEYIDDGAPEAWPRKFDRYVDGKFDQTCPLDEGTHETLLRYGYMSGGYRLEEGNVEYRPHVPAPNAEAPAAPPLREVAAPPGPSVFPCRLGASCHHCSPPKPVPFVPTVDDWDLLPDAFNLRGGR